jgi:transcriptional regulator of aromatic amino acid metabolism
MEPVREFLSDGTLPVRLDGSGALIIRDVPQLTRSQQEALLQFITLHPLVSIIALSSESLWRYVQSGEFSETLFYRLNVLTIGPTRESPVEEST